MSKPNLRKITVDPTKCNTDSRRPSVFERLGTKPAAANTSGQNTSDYCRNWALNGSCSYGKTCKYASTHTLISPSKRVKKDNAPTNPTVPNEDPFKRLTSKIVKKTTSHSPDLNIEDWNQTDLEYEDEKVLERRRQLLQRELELQMKKDKEVHGKDKTKHKKKAMSSSSSSHSSSSSSSSSTSSSDDSSSSSTSDSRRKVKKVKSKRHHSPSSDYDEDKERKKKLKLKRLGTKSEKVIVKKKRKIEIPKQKETIAPKVAKKVVSSTTRKHSTTRQKSPQISSSHAVSAKFKERNQSESPKLKSRETEKEKHHKKAREEEILAKEMSKSKVAEKIKDADKPKSRAMEERGKPEERSKPRLKEKEIRSRTPPLEKSKHHHSKDLPNLKTRRSRTPEKSARSKRDTTPLPRNQEVKIPLKSREIDTKKERDFYRGDRGKDKDDVRKPDLPKARPSSSQDDSHRQKTGARECEEKNYGNERNRQRSKERRDKDNHNPRDDRSHSRLGRDQRDKERDEVQERCRERQRERDRDKDPVKAREREIPPLMATTALNPLDKSGSGRYNREKDRFKDSAGDKSASRDRRAERDRERSEKPLERDRGLQRGFEGRYDRSVDTDMSGHKGVDRDARAPPSDRFPRERSMENRIVQEKNISGPREHPMDRENLYERDRLRRFNPRFDRGHPSDHDRKDPPHIAPKIDRLTDRRQNDGSRRSLEIERNYDRGYARLPPERWDDTEEPSARIDYRDHRGGHDDDRRKPMDGRRYNSPFDPERRGRDERPSRYSMQADRPFDEPHMPHFGGEKMRGGVNRDESSNENWDVHHEIEHASRDRNYTNSDWEEREWRARPPMWDRESPPRSEVHEEEWAAAARYDSPMPDWKMNEGRKWENPGHPRGPYRNDRVKDLDLTDVSHGKRRQYGTPELRDECSTHGSKQGSLHGSMKEEPINKKLMELAEGRIRRSREKSPEPFPKRISHPPPISTREKSEVKEIPIVAEPKRPCLDESLQTLHTESDLSDISDDPDDILNMDEEETSAPPKPPSPKKSTDVVEREVKIAPQVNEQPQLSPKEIVEDQIFTKEKDTNESMEFRNIADDNVENMDFEEISDGELEEDIKTSGKGLGDALGVDWESLVKESQPIRANAGNQVTAQSRWQCKAIFQRIGVSSKYAGPELLETLSEKYQGDADTFLHHDVALLHVSVARQRMMDDASRNSSNFNSLSSRYLAEADEEEEENEDVLKPCTNLLEEVQQLLQNPTKPL